MSVTNRAVTTRVPEVGPIEVRNINNATTLYIRASQVRLSGRFFVEVSMTPREGFERVNPRDFLQPDIIPSEL